MRNNGQSCNDCGLPGEPVPGQEDVYAWVPPTPLDHLFTNLSEFSAQAGAASPSRIQVLAGIPPMDVPAANAPRPAAVNTPHGGFLASLIRDAIADASASPDVEYLPRLGAPWFDTNGAPSIGPRTHPVNLMRQGSGSFGQLSPKPGDMTPSQEEAWEKMLREMEEEEQRAKQAELDRIRAEAERETARLAKEAKLKAKLARLARRTKEEIEYDDTLEKLDNARNEETRRYKTCLADAKADYDACVKTEDEAYEQYRDLAAQGLIACAIVAGGPIGIAGCIVAYEAARIACSELHVRGVKKCGSDYERVRERCHRDHLEAWKKIDKDIPVPPKPPTHDY